MEDAESQRFSERVLSPQKWQSLEKIYHAAVSIGHDERRTFLEQACADDDELRREADSLLAADDAADNFLEDPAVFLCMKVLVEEETWRAGMSSETTQRFESAPAAGKPLDDRWEIIEKLGAGGMGEVYKARDLRLHRLVVVKILKEERLQDEWIVSRFKREAEVLAKIDDPGVVGILDVGTLREGQLPYLVMQHVEGSDLSKLIKADGGMDFIKTAEIMRQATRALRAAHEAGVIHRDLKPGNIMIRQDTRGELQVKVIDFGIAKVIDSVIRLEPATAYSVGTPSYMAPEQLKLDNQLKGVDVTPASDVYALGVIAYEMLTGNRPFSPKFLGELPELQKKGVKDKLRVLRSDLPKAAEQVILKALEYNASKRQQSAREFGDDLERALTPISPPQNTFDWRVIAAAAVALVIVIVGLLWWELSARTLSPESVVTERPQGIPTSGTASPIGKRIYDTDFWFPTGKSPKDMIYAGIGFTVYRTRPATSNESADTAREIVDNQETASERIADDISNGEQIYLVIESLTGEFLPDKGGYLYVVNREQNANGTFGRARLIFPTLLTYGGNNRIKPGLPILLPGKDRPFTVKRSSAQQAAETFSIVLSPWAFQLPEPLGDKAMVLDDNLFAGWEREYGARMYRATLRGSVGQTRTKREQSVSNREIIDDAEQSLTQGDPLPQTVFRGAVKIGNPAMVTVALPFRD